MNTKQLNETHSAFEVQCFSPTLNKYVTRIKDAVHSTIEGATKVVNNFQACKWQIVGLHKQHKQWHTVKEGRPMSA